VTESPTTMPIFVTTISRCPALSDDRRRPRARPPDRGYEGVELGVKVDKAADR
jgi:hypothetical protein